MNNFILKKSVWLIALCFLYVQVQAQCDDFAFAGIYDDCECCDSYIYFELTGGTPPYNVVTEFGQEIFSGIAANDVNPQAFETNLIATDANGCETSGVAVFAYFCCEVPPSCEIYGLTYGCDEGLQLEAYDIFGGPGDCQGLETITLDGNVVETGIVLDDGIYTFDVELEYPPCTFYTFDVEVDCGFGGGSCDIEDPLSLAWVVGVVADADCFCNYQVRYDCHNGEGLFIVEPGFPTICSDIQTFYYDVDGNLLCTAGGFIGAECPDYDASNGGEVIWTCGGDCLANAGTIGGDEIICGFGAGLLSNTAPSIPGYDYVYLSVEGDDFFVLEDNYTYTEGCYHGLSYEIANPPNFDASSFSEFLTDETACFAVTPCFYVEYIFPPEFGVTTPPECINFTEFVVGISIYGGTGQYSLTMPNGEVITLIGDGVEQFVTYTFGSDFYDIYPIDAITGCGNDYVVGFEAPECFVDCFCDDVYDPVCGTNGITYDNACIAACQGAEVAYLGECQTDVCSLPPDSGPCEAAILRYYFDASTSDCATFTYGGCAGNANNFETYELCMSSCGNIYQAPGCTDVAGVDFGACAAVMGVALVNGECVGISGCSNFIVDGVDYSNAFYDNLEICFESCQNPCALIDCPAVYDPVCGIDGVTYGNSCEAECAGVAIAYLGECETDVCSLPPDSGICLAAIQRYYYDSAASDCATFTWGGCGGNANNFETYELCMSSCGNIYQAPGCTDVANVDFGDCEAIMGVAVVNGECVTLSGCLDFIIAGVDYTNAFFENEEICFEYCQNPCALIDCSDVYDPVCGVDGVTYTNACIAECVGGVEVAYLGACTDEPLSPIFENYTWLIDIVNPLNCNSGDVVTVYNVSVFSFIFIESNGVGTLYFEDGTYYCQSAPNFDCVSIYGLGNPIDSWSCGELGCICNEIYDPVCGVDGNTYDNACEAACLGVEVAYAGVCENNSNPALFDEYSWLSSILNPNNCSAGDVVTEYDLGPYSFIFIESNGVGALYFEDGAYYCQNSPGFDCELLYGLTSPTASWSCSDDCVCPTLDAPVCGVDGNTYGNPCFAECAGVEVAYVGVCENNPNPALFEEYSWLSSILNPNNCSAGDAVTEYDLGPYSFIFVESNGVGTLYFEDGAYYCQNSPGFDCELLYGLTSPTASWSCGGVVPTNPEIFETYVWLNDLIDLGLCEDEVVTEYDLGSYSFVYIEANGEGTLYFEDGTYYCQDFPNFSCLNAYGLDAPTNSWICDGLDRPAPICTEALSPIIVCHEYGDAYRFDELDLNTEDGFVQNLNESCFRYTPSITAQGDKEISTIICNEEGVCEMVLFTIKVGNCHSVSTLTQGYQPVETRTRPRTIIAENEGRLGDINGLDVFTMYPNPTTDKVVVQLINKDDYEKTIGLYDLRGTMLKETIIPANSNQSSITMDVQDLPTGLYMIQLRTPNQSVIQRLIKR